MKTQLLDKTNRELISLLESNPKLTVADLSRSLDLAQSTIAVRLEKLSKAKMLKVIYGTDIQELGLQTAQVNIKTIRPDLVLKWAEKCPLFANASVSVAGNELGLVFMAEDPEGFHDIINEHLLKIEGLIDFNFSNILEWTRGVHLPLDLAIPRSDKPPCGMAQFCRKCPGNRKYSGKIWTEAK